MSQEELGERLFVSRQTVSQWETGQTQPTLDNLLRLREIFGVSIDELMGVAEPEEEASREPEPAAPVPPEPKLTAQYTVEYSGAEVREICAKRTEKSITLLLLSATFAVLSFMWSLNVDYPEFFLILCGMFWMGVIFCIAWLIECRGATERAVCRMNGKKYCFSMLNGNLRLRILDDDKVVLERLIGLHEIKCVRETKSFIVFECNDGAIYALRRAHMPDMPEFHVIYSALKSLENYKPRPKSPALRGWGTALFVLSLTSVMIGLIISVLLGFAFPLEDGTPAFFERLWGFWLALPIPIMSIVIGVMLEKRDMPYKKNIVVAIIMIPLLILYGSLSLFAQPIYSPDPIAYVEEQLMIDIPDDVNFSESRQYNQTIAYATLSESDAEVFEKQLDDRWLTEVPKEQEVLHILELDIMQFDRVLLYDLDMNEYNSLPEHSGETCTFIAMYYNTQFNELTVAQYSIEY